MIKPNNKRINQNLRGLSWLAIFLLFCSFAGQGKEVLRKLDIPDLSNNAILYIHQDNDGNMWFGSYDGLNFFNGKNTYVYRYEPGNNKSIDGNIIRKIVHGGPDHIWVSTIIGLNRISLIDKRVEESYPQYPETHSLAADSLGNLLIVSLDDFISFYSPQTESFQDIYAPGIKATDVREFFTDKQDHYYLLSYEGLLKQIELNTHTLPASVEMREIALHMLEIEHASYDADEDVLFFVDITQKLYEYDIQNQQKNLVADLSALHTKYSGLSRVLSWKSDVYVSYMNSGLVRIKRGETGGNTFYPMNMNVGVFSLCKDQKQDILWIGTDGQGAHMLYEDNKSFRILPSTLIPYSTQKPVRGIYTDEDHTLWIATKGDGVIRIRDYDSQEDQPIEKDKVVHYHTGNGLSNNQAFCFMRSHDEEVLWIGSEGPGLSYYSYTDDKLYTIDCNVRWVHSICEINDSTLWLATAGGGLLRLILDKSTTPFSLKHESALVFDIRERICNNFHSMIFDGDSSLIIGIRGGFGAIRYNFHTNEYRLLSLDKGGSSAIGDVLCVYQDTDSVYYLGASSGLTKIESNGMKRFNRKDGIANDMIHGILKDEAGCLWLSTNRGLTKYNPENDLFHNYYHPDFTVTEFSDDSYWKCPYTHRLFFGGINGLVWIDRSDSWAERYLPELRFLDVTMNGVTRDLSAISGELVIPPRTSTFKISFLAINYISGDNYEYAYTMDNYTTAWEELQKDNEVTFTNLPYGRYMLRVKYKADVFGGDKEYQLPVYVKPPWYLTHWAIMAYVLLFVLVCAGIIEITRRRLTQKQHLMARQIKEEQKEKLYEAKLNFFTNITHELCTPLTLINGITENIGSFTVKESGEEFNKHISILRNNVNELNELIQEVLDFRKVEGFGLTDVTIKQVNLSEFVRIQTDLFLPAIEKNKVNFNLDIPENLFWYTDLSFFKRILVNLLSNAFKYVFEGGDIRVSLKLEDDKLILRVFNTGIGIEESQVKLLFDRFRIFDQMDENKYLQMTARHGLGLYICYNLVHLLKGYIQVKSEPNAYAEVIVTLPKLDVKPVEQRAKEPELNGTSDVSNKISILIVDDNKDIVWLISNTLSGQYNILEAPNAEEALKLMEKQTPALIITDIIMPGIDGLELIKQIKQNKFTKHIPVIIVSAKLSDKDQAEGLNAGADAYLTKPFSSLVLQSTVNRLISTKKDLKEYYYSPESAYELLEGQLFHQEDKDFVDSVIAIIRNNLDKENLRLEWIAEQLGLNSRNLYRRFKKITSVSPSDFIKEYRFTYAAQLLVTTNLSIQEIIYKVGVSNKSYFYREFFKRYQMTPKEYRVKQ